MGSIRCRCARVGVALRWRVGDPVRRLRRHLPAVHTLLLAGHVHHRVGRDGRDVDPAAAVSVVADGFPCGSLRPSCADVLAAADLDRPADDRPGGSHRARSPTGSPTLVVVASAGAALVGIRSILVGIVRSSSARSSCPPSGVSGTWRPDGSCRGISNREMAGGARRDDACDRDCLRAVASLWQGPWCGVRVRPAIDRDGALSGVRAEIAVGRFAEPSPRLDAAVTRAGTTNARGRIRTCNPVPKTDALSVELRVPTASLPGVTVRPSSHAARRRLRRPRSMTSTSPSTPIASASLMHGKAAGLSWVSPTIAFRTRASSPSGSRPWATCPSRTCPARRWSAACRRRRAGVKDPRSRCSTPAATPISMRSLRVSGRSSARSTSSCTDRLLPTSATGQKQVRHALPLCLRAGDGHLGAYTVHGDGECAAGVSI